MGIDPYSEFAGLKAYYIHGVGYLTFNVGEQSYKLIGAHKLPGFSMYNNVHPQMRASKEIQGADIYFSGHNHRKGHGEQGIKEFGGESRWVHAIALGAYKSTDEYARKKGFAQQTTKEMYGCAIKLYANEKRIEYFDDILLANK